MEEGTDSQFRISQGFETPLFLQLFEGNLIIRSSSSDAVPVFLVRGATAREGHAAQFDDCQPFRAHAVYIHVDKGKISLVAGAQCGEMGVKNGLAICDELLRHGKDFGLKVTSFVEWQ